MSDDNINYNYIFKYIIIGDSAVVKSKLLLWFTDNTYKIEFQCTVGVEFGYRNLEIKKIVWIQIWDTTGMKNFVLSQEVIIKILLGFSIYDICNRESFNIIEKCIIDCKK